MCICNEEWRKRGSGISCASSSSSVVNYGCVYVSLVLWEASVVWLVAKNSPLSWHTGPIYDPSHSAEGSPASGLSAHFPQRTQNCGNTEIPPAALQKEIPLAYQLNATVDMHTKTPRTGWKLVYCHHHWCCLSALFAEDGWDVFSSSCNKMRQNWPQNQKSLRCFQLSASCQKSGPEVSRTAAHKTTKVKINALNIPIFNCSLVTFAPQLPVRESVTSNIKEVCYFTHTHTQTQVNFTVFCTKQT